MGTTKSGFSGGRKMVVIYVCLFTKQAYYDQCNIWSGDKECEINITQSSQRTLCVDPILCDCAYVFLLNVRLFLGVCVSAEYSQTYARS